MAFVPVPNTALVEAIYQLDSQICENTLYFEFASGAPTGADLADLVEAVNSAIRTSILPFLTTVTQLLRVVGTLLDVADAIQFTSVTSLPAAGGVASETMPNSSAACISFRTGLTGRSFRGRNYILGIPVGNVTQNTLNSDWTALMVTGWNSIGSAAFDIGWNWVAVSRVSGGLDRAEGVTTPISAVLFTDNIIDTQRRRGPGRGA
jgi:hypothetical protein